MVRGIVLALLVGFVGVAQVRLWAQMGARRAETAWVRSLQGPTPGQATRLKDELLGLGAQLYRQGGATRIDFAGPEAAWVRLVNRLLAQPYAWSSWSGEKTSTGQVKGSITVEAL